MTENDKRKKAFKRLWFRFILGVVILSTPWLIIKLFKPFQLDSNYGLIIGILIGSLLVLILNINSNYIYHTQNGTFDKVTLFLLNPFGKKSTITISNDDNYKLIIKKKDMFHRYERLIVIKDTDVKEFKLLVNNLNVKNDKILSTDS